MNECEKWLVEFLRKEGTVLCDTVRDEAKKQGFNKTQLKAARKALGVKTFHFFDECGETPNWFWHLKDSEV